MKWDIFGGSELSTSEEEKLNLVEGDDDMYRGVAVPAK